jgi:hypothetical protein
MFLCPARDVDLTAVSMNCTHLPIFPIGQSQEDAEGG